MPLKGESILVILLVGAIAGTVHAIRVEVTSLDSSGQTATIGVRYWLPYAPVYAEGSPGNGIGGYDLADDRDRAFPFDYTGSGKLDHLARPFQLPKHFDGKELLHFRRQLQIWMVRVIRKESVDRLIEVWREKNHHMPALSFRLKLLLAMMLVVGGVSFATLFVTQRSVQNNYERMFRKQFERQLAYFTGLQDARLSPLKEMALNLCQDARYIVAMRREHPALAREWRMTMRKALGGALEDGYVITGATRAGWYVLEKQ